METRNTIISLVGISLLTSCAPALIAGTGVAVGSAITQEKTVGEIIDDLTIKTEIKNELAKVNLASEVGVKVTEGSVLLNGIVPTAHDRLLASKIAWNEPGVKEVINDIIIKSESDKTVGKITDDSLITAKIKAKLLLNKNVKSVNYGFETINGTVYIMGIAQNQEELNRVLNIVRQVKGVKKTVNHVKVKK